MLGALLMAALACAVDVAALVAGRFEFKSVYWLRDSGGDVILPFVQDFDNAAESNCLWMMVFLLWSASAAFASVPLLYYYGANRFRASGWAVSWANLVAAMAAGRIGLLVAVLYVFHFGFLQELSGSREPLLLSEIAALYGMKIIGSVPMGIGCNVLVTAVFLVLLLASLKETRQWRRLNVRKIY